jgi:hypothetical protein
MTEFKMKLELTLAEVNVLYEEIGDLPHSKLGPKLRGLYRRFESYIAMTAPYEMQKRGPKPKEPVE